jgi:hypothetical protein
VQGIEKARVPVRGTQSFVGVMSKVWRRPSLTVLEMTWRAVAALAFVFAAGVALGSLRVTGGGSAVDTSAIQAMTVFKPVDAAGTLRTAAESAITLAWPRLRWLLPEAMAFWLIVAALGRTLVLRRLDGTLKAATVSMLALGTFRAVLLGGVWALWGWGVAWASRVAITGPAAGGGEPNVVGFCALLICGTLGLYVAWGAASWPLQLAPLLAMRYGLGPVASLGRALHAGAVRGKLVEINLVMNIVKLALIVLAMVFSASPLPFSTVTTQEFLACWWAGVGVLYLGMSDYFHVVRAAAYLEMWRAFED